MEQTQLLDWDEEEELDDPSDGVGGSGETPKPVGRLHLLSSKYGPEKDFWIYPGENVIGRLESCQICLPASSVSKAHAVIEVPSPDGPHLLYDRGSLNRTRRQRVALIPQVRYSLQDGDTLLFGDVGCQYFLLAPGGAPDDSMEVPPTQTRAETTALAIEETPAPGRKMGFGGVLAQDSDEEEGEDVVNGTGGILRPPVMDGSDSSVKGGAGGWSKLATSMFSSPSATVVPESDEESGEASVTDPSCPSLRLCFDSQDAEPLPLENGGVASSDPEGHPVQAAAAEAEAKVPPDSGELTAKEQAASTDPGLVDFHLDSDTDVEDEGRVGSASDTPTSVDMAKDGKALEVGSDTDTEEPVGTNPGAGSATNHQLDLGEGSDTDVEEGGEGPGLPGLKARPTAGKGADDDDDTDLEGETENQRPVPLTRREPLPPNEDSCKDAEGSGGDRDLAHPDEKGDLDTDVEEAVGDPGVCERALLPTENEHSDTDVEDAPLKEENPNGPSKIHAPVGDSDGDTDVEMADLAVEDSDVAGPHSPHPPGCQESSSRAEGSPSKGPVPQGSSSLDEGEGREDAVGEVKDPSRRPQSTHGAVNECSRALGDRKSSESLEVTGKVSVVPQNPPLLVLSVDSDTDVEEEAKNPEVDSKENHTVPGAGPRGGSSGSCFGNPDFGPQKSPGTIGDADKDTDTEAASPFRKDSVAQDDSDTDVEEASAPLPEKPLEEQDTQLLVPVRSAVAGEKAAGSLMAVRVHREPCKEDEDTDAEGNESRSGDGSATDDDADLAFQATQCFLPTETSSPRIGKTPRDAAEAGSSCALEEEATQAFDVAGDLKATQLQLRKASVTVPSSPGSSVNTPECSSPLKDDDTDPDAYVLEATQSFCTEPRRLSEEPTQAFISEAEEETEPISLHLPEQTTQPVVLISASGGQQAASLSGHSTQACPIGVPCMEPVSQPAGGTTAEETEKEGEAQTVNSGQAPPVGNSQPSTLQEEVKGASRNEEQVAPEGRSPAQLSQPRDRAARVDDESEERSSTPAGEARDAKQVAERAQEEASESPAPGQRRTLRSSTAAASPAPAPERQSRRRRGRVGSGDRDGRSEPAAPVTRRRGMRPLAHPAQCRGEPEAKSEEPEGEEVSPVKKPRNREPTSAVHPGRTRGSQRESGAASRLKEETAKAAVSPAARVPAKRGKWGTAAEPVAERQPELPRTRASTRSGSASGSTPSPKDSGTGAKPGQEPMRSTPPSARRSQRLSTESQPAGRRAQSWNQSQGAAGSGVPAPKVLFTGVIDEEGERVVTELGGSLAESVFDCTHLVTDRVRRTVKFLCALARGIPIVTLDWLEKSKRNSVFLAPNSFLVCDPEQEKNFQFSLTMSLQRAQKEGGLLQGYEIHVTPNVKPEPEHMRDIVKCSGGTFFPRMPRAYKDKRVVISCPADLPRCKPAQDARVPIVNSEFILTGILQQKIDLDGHRLDGLVATSPVASPAALTTRVSKRRAGVLTAPAPPSTAKRRR
ncbi:mediator of DNA damage checkpoint protein 1 [Elgaria multicarinata webbii]|uniref:mediator of DNA damage checkpoint protein 1 n=1 Tax=Elgaria multicarinata webbii TaxID=159646 RepID=UPI002FCCE5BD